MKKARKPLSKYREVKKTVQMKKGVGGSYVSSASSSQASSSAKSVVAAFESAQAAIRRSSQ